jgi:hypothetical protein
LKQKKDPESPELGKLDFVIERKNGLRINIDALGALNMRISMPTPHLVLTF